MTAELQSHFLNLYAMALSDTQIETVELETLYNIGKERGIEKTEIDQLLLHPDRVKFSYPESLNEKIVYLYDFAKIIIADEVIDLNERKTLELFCTKFGFEEQNVLFISNFLLDSAKADLKIENLLEIINENIN